MIIKLPRMPLKFHTPDGEMEVTVRESSKVTSTGNHLFCGAAAFITHGPRALERIPLTGNLESHTEVLRVLLTGFKVGVHEEGTLNYRVLKSLCATTGVEEIDTN